MNYKSMRFVCIAGEFFLCALSVALALIFVHIDQYAAAISMLLPAGATALWGISMWVQK